MAPRVLYTDVDGTLVGPLGNLLWDSDRTPTTSTAEALVRAAREGLEIVPVTGRSQAGMREAARLLGLATWFCELGGIRVYERGAEAVVDHGAFAGSAPVMTELYETFARLADRFPGQLEEHHPWNASREVSLVLRGGVDLAKAEEYLTEAGCGWAELVDNGVIPRRYETLPTVERVHAYHLVPRGVSKATAIAADQARRGLAQEDCAMVGDAAADLECRRYVGRCFLVRNGLIKDPGLAWAAEPGSGVEVTSRTHGEGFADVVHWLLDGT